MLLHLKVLDFSFNIDTYVSIYRVPIEIRMLWNSYHLAAFHEADRNNEMFKQINFQIKTNFFYQCQQKIAATRYKLHSICISIGSL